jgi:hypothetical protein
VISYKTGPREVTAETVTNEQIDALTCTFCSAPATCIARYDLDEGEPPEPACDTCCGHVCEGGLCYQIRDQEGDLCTAAMPWCAAAINARARENK